MKKTVALSVFFTALMILGASAFAQMKFEPGKKTTVNGKAENTKIAAAVIAEDGQIYYLSGMDSWQDDIPGKNVTVTGKLYSVEINENMLVDSQGNRIQGIPGNTLYLRDPVIRKVR